jgi:hypothetical protein
MSERRYDMDWIRVIVFDILIFWHVGLFFVSWSDLVQWDLPMKNNVQVGFLATPMLFIRQWRLPILFVVSGMGTSFSLASKNGFQYLKDRFLRLFVPLLCGIFLVIPPQVYLERIVEGTVDVSYFVYYPSTFEGIYPEGNLSWGHLWFLPYLLLMSVAALPLFLSLRNNGNRLIAHGKNLLEKSPLYLYLPVIPLFVIEIILEPRFPLTMALKDDWYAFSFYFVCLVAGFFLATLGQVTWKSFVKIRYLSLLAGILASLALWMLTGNDYAFWIHLVKPLNTWSWILCIFGFGSKYLNVKSKILTYRNQAVYPFYILHFTIIIFLGFLLMDLPMHYAWKMIIMVIGTYGISWILYEFIIRRIPLLRILFGLKQKKNENDNTAYSMDAAGLNCESTASRRSR